MDVILIRAVSSCWISGIGSAEALLSPDDTLCLPPLGRARGMKIRKEEENTTLIPGNSLEKTSDIFCCYWALPFNLWCSGFFSYECIKLFFNNGGGSIFLLLQGSCSECCYLVHSTILLAQIVFMTQRNLIWMQPNVAAAKRCLDPCLCTTIVPAVGKKIGQMCIQKG